MSVYIKGMEMPKNCGACPLRLAWCRERIYMVTRPERCPLVPVHEHGRLIDADALPEQMLRNLFEIEDKAEKELGFDQTLRRGMQYGHAVCVDAVNDAPTIIPADKEGEG